MELDLSYKDLSSVDGTVFPDGLEKLYLSGNRLTSLPPLPQSIKILYCDENQLTSLPPLPPSLKVLRCETNRLTSLPPLPQSLIRLFCSDNLLTSLPPLPPSLKELYCVLNQLTDLPPLPHSLTRLYCPGNQLPDHYLLDGRHKSIRELNVIILFDRWKRALSIVRRMILDRQVRKIQRIWKRYWLEPYHDPQLGYRVSRYLLHYRDTL